VASELFGTWGVLLAEGLCCIGVPVLFAVTLAQEVSYCEVAPTLLFNCAVLYAAPPLPPLTLTTGVPLERGSLCVEPGDVAELPGALVASVAGGLPPLVPHPKPWRLSAYAGGAPMTAMATMQPAENSLCLMFRSPFPGAHHSAPYGFYGSQFLRVRGFWTCAY
jgi:hypothetical protein